MLLEIEQPIVREILDGLPVGVALDAACGTGRHTAYLASLGHEVIGVDTSPEMLAHAREKVPDGAFYEAGLHDVALPDDSVDVSSVQLRCATWRTCGRRWPSSCVFSDRAGTW
jgi:ubiquinone/menaquinone biosynthesis C-methylase UbiE